VDTVPDPVANLRATPGNGNVVVSWAASAMTGGVPLDTTSPYLLTATSTGPTITIHVPPSAAGPCLKPEANVCYDVTGLTNGRLYRFAVVAVNAIGPSDAALPVAPQANTSTPSTNSAARIIAPNTAWGLPATCSVATPTKPICVTQFAASTGGGGIVAIQAGVPVAPNFCGLPCPGGAGVLVFASSTSWVTPTRPIVVTITWDASLGLHQPAIYAKTGSGTPTALARCATGVKANPDPCLRSYQTINGNQSNPSTGDRLASILLTSDVGFLVLAQP